MLGLPCEVGRHQVHVGRVIRNDGGLGRTGHHVDADATEQRAFGFGHEAVAAHVLVAVDEGFDAAPELGDDPFPDQGREGLDPDLADGIGIDTRSTTIT